MARLLAFDLVGPVAHFRKFYTNSSSLSYTFPPRSVLAGLIAGLLGMERHDYHEAMSPDRARIAVAVKTPTRKILQTVNYLFTKGPFDSWMQTRTQIPVELVLPRRGWPYLRYRVYFTHRDEGLVEELHRLASHGGGCFPPYLGITECLAWTEPVALADLEEVESSDPLPLATVVPEEALAGEVRLREGVRLYGDVAPTALKRDRRPLTGPRNHLWWEPADGRRDECPPPLEALLRVPAFRLPDRPGAFGVFL